MLLCNDVNVIFSRYGCFKLASSPVCARGPLFILVISPLPVRGRTGHTPTPPPSVQEALGALENPAAGESACLYLSAAPGSRFGLSYSLRLLVHSLTRKLYPSCYVADVVRDSIRGVSVGFWSRNCLPYR